MKPLVITNKGKELVAKLVEGTTTAKFTKLVSSSKDYSEIGIAELTQLENIEQETEVASIEKTDNYTVLVSFALENTEINTGYYIKTLGIYAEDDNGNIILFGVCISDEIGEYLPAFGGATPYVLEYRIYVKVDNAEQITIEVSSSAYATASQLANLQVVIDTHTDTKINSESGVHGIRHYNNNLGYYDDALKKWIDIETTDEEAVKQLIADNATTVNVVDSLDSVKTDEALSANQGNVLKKAIETAESNIDKINGKKYSTVVVGLSTMGYIESDVDYLCTGTNDNTIINQALSNMTSGGELKILEGTYSISSSINIANNDIDIVMTSATNLVSTLTEASTTENNILTRNKIFSITGTNISLSGGNIGNASGNGNIAIYCNGGNIRYIHDVHINNCACGVATTGRAEVGIIDSCTINIVGLGTGTCGVYTYNSTIDTITNCMITSSYIGINKSDMSIIKNVFMCDISSSDTSIYAINGIGNIESCTISSDSDVGMLFNHPQACVVINCKINSGKIGIQTLYAVDINIINCTITSSTYGIHAGGTISKIANCTITSMCGVYTEYATIKNIDSCIITSDGGNGIYNTNDSYVGNISNCTIRSNNIGYCVYAPQGTFGDIINCNIYISDNGNTYGIHASRQIGNIMGNTIHATGTGGHSYGIYINANMVFNFVVSGNTVVGDNASGGYSMMFYGSDYSCIVTDNILNKAVVSNSTTTRDIRDNLITS